jgi:endonuclease/exonuclease/phosphatase family metal-dependent hydrolase
VGAAFAAALAAAGCSSPPSPLEGPPAGAAAQAAGTPSAWRPGGEITVLSWNLGFAGLGEGSEFCPDGGHRLIPSSRREVLRNAEGIGGFVERCGAELFLFQEAARPSAVNRRVDLLAELRGRLPGRWNLYSPEVRLRLPRVSVGLAVFSPGSPGEAERIELPQEKGKGWQRFHLLVTRFPEAGGGGQLVLVDVHLAAFDPGASVRGRQLEALRDFLLAEAAQGSHVVAGGDWNLLLAATAFPYTTRQRYLGWVHPLPADFLPAGWRLAVDGGIPSVRSLERPYVRGENYTAVIDGFAVSPNVTVLEAHTFDLAFRFSDHQPVMARLRLD